MGISFQRFFEDLLIKSKSFYLSQYMMCKMLNNLSDGKLERWFIRDDGILTIDLTIVLSSPCEYCLKRKHSVEKYSLYLCYYRFKWQIFCTKEKFTYSSF